MKRGRKGGTQPTAPQVIGELTAAMLAGSALHRGMATMVPWRSWAASDIAKGHFSETMKRPKVPKV